jgi:excisionase family DNA binding protein
MPKKPSLSHVRLTHDLEVPPLFPVGDHRKTVNVEELAELTGIPIPTLRDWIHQGAIPGAFQRKKHTRWRFRREFLEKWWEELLTRHLK